MAELPDYTLYEAAEGLRAGSFSSKDLCREMLQRVEKVDGRVKAYLHLDEPAILQAAEEADARRKQGEQRSELDGLPVAIKDNISVKSQPCGCASSILSSYTATYDAAVIRGLRGAGMIPFGRTNMDEFAMGSTTENSGRWVTANPWDEERVPGGSSGGSAAAVASHTALAALGSDTGGSVRQPAGFCGTVGMKPTYGRVSRYGLVAFASSLDQIGPVTRDVRDNALLLDVITGRDKHDATSIPDSETNASEALRQADASKLTVGLPKEFLEAEGLDSEVREEVEKNAERFRELGAEIKEVALPRTEYAVSAYYIIAPAEASANLARFDGIRYGNRSQEGEQQNLLETYRRSREDGFGDEVKRRILLGTYVLSSGYYDAYYLKAQKVRTLIREDFENAFSTCDVLLGPVSPTPAYRRGEISTPLQMYLGDVFTTGVNLAGICGVSVPTALNTEGVPLSVQLIGPAMGEEKVLQAALKLEQASDVMDKTAPVGETANGR